LSLCSDRDNFMIETLIKGLKQEYHIALDDLPTQLSGGYECDVWRVGDYVVRVCPEWRSEAEIRWTYEFVRHCAETVPEVVAPIQTKAGDDFIVYEGRVVLVFPYIDGDKLSRLNKNHLWQSARTLARIHLTSAEKTSRPSSNPSRPTIIPIQADPKIIQDPALDAWYNQFVQRNDLILGMMHGDYYRGNILCRDDKIQGVIDWDECNYGVIIREVAWATWEMCQDEIGDELDTLKAMRFLYAYVQVYPEMLREMNAIVPLIRYHLRYEIRRSIAMEEAGRDWDDVYRQAEIRAFNNLRNVILSIF